MASVTFDNVSKRFADSNQALDALSLEIADGELMVLVGPSGCGKSTALRLLAGLETVTEGDIRIDGDSVLALSPQQRNIAMVFQSYALYPHMSVYDNLAFPLRMAGLSRIAIDKTVREVAEVLELGALLGRKPAALSGGQRQRVAMGRAMVRKPKVFLLDEPLSNLDAKLRTQVRAEIAALQRRLQATMIYVTHDQAEAMTLGHRIAVLFEGRLQQVGTPEALYDAPANRFVAGFLGSPPTNLFEVEVNEESGELCFKNGEVALPVPPRWRSTLRAYRNQSMEIGLRPEAFPLAPEANTNDTLTLEVLAEERLGHERLIYCASPWPTLDATGQAQQPAQLIVRAASGPAFAPNATVTVAIDTTQLHVFDRDGRALCLEAGR